MNASDNVPELDPRTAAREVRAERYFEHDLAGQRGWYGQNASRFKRRLQMLGLGVLVAGAATTILQTFGNTQWVPIATALLGALVTVMEGWRQIARYEETWSAYRTASERMKRERRLYCNGAGDYHGIDDEEDAFRHFVEALEGIVAEEQHIYWQARQGGTGTSQQAQDGGAGKK